jgi:hypothetical protein
LFYTSPVGSKFIDDLMYIYDYHTASSADDYQPCLLKLERAASRGQFKQFSLKTIEQYFKNAGNKVSSPGQYQIEHFFLREPDEQDNAPVIQKAPLSKNASVEIKADEHHIVRSYRFVDLTGEDYSKKFVNRRILSYNSTSRQFNFDVVSNVAEEWKTFFNSKIKPNVVVSNSVSNDRLPLTPYITDGSNTLVEFSSRPTMGGRYAVGRNKLFKYFLFSNLCISFTVRGLTHRQPGRFFGLSKQSLNDKDYDHKLEGQYFVTNVRHYFSNKSREYSTEIVAVKSHVYKENTSVPSGDVNILGGSSL